jgi:hypothetical protein
MVAYIIGEQCVVVRERVVAVHGNSCRSSKTNHATAATTTAAATAM